MRTHDLRLKLIRTGVKKPKCEKCLNSTWNGEPIPLELHHIDGIRENNELDNLQILCPNCHAQTPNHAGKALRGRVEKKRNFCKNCGIEISLNATWCKTHSAINREAKFKKYGYPESRKKTKIEWPSDSDLIEILSEQSYQSVAKAIGVSDNAIRKRLKNLGLNPKDYGRSWSRR